MAHLRVSSLLLRTACMYDASAQQTSIKYQQTSIKYVTATFLTTTTSAVVLGGRDHNPFLTTTTSAVVLGGRDHNLTTTCAALKSTLDVFLYALFSHVCCPYRVTRRAPRTLLLHAYMLPNVYTHTHFVPAQRVSTSLFFSNTLGDHDSSMDGQTIHTEWNNGMPISVSVRPTLLNKTPNFTPQSHAHMGASEHSSSRTVTLAPTSNPGLNFGMHQGRPSTAPVPPSTPNPMMAFAAQQVAAFGMRQMGFPPPIPGQDSDMGFGRVPMVRPGSAPLPMGLPGASMAMGGMQVGQNAHALMSKKRQQGVMMEESDQMKRQRIENGQMSNAQPPKTFAQQQQMFHQQQQQKASMMQQMQPPGRLAQQHSMSEIQETMEIQEAMEAEARRLEEEEQEQLQKRQQELRKLLQEQLKAKQLQQVKPGSHAASSSDSSMSNKNSQAKSAAEGAQSRQISTAQSAPKAQGKQAGGGATSASSAGLTSDGKRRAVDDVRKESVAAGSREGAAAGSREGAAAGSRVRKLQIIC
jgi:hypothetical protein